MLRWLGHVATDGSQRHHRSLGREAATDSDVVAAGVSEGELVHVPRHVLDRGDRQSGGDEAGMPVVGLLGDDVAAGVVRRRVEIGDRSRSNTLRSRKCTKAKSSL